MHYQELKIFNREILKRQEKNEEETEKPKTQNHCLCASVAVVVL